MYVHVSFTGLVPVGGRLSPRDSLGPPCDSSRTSRRGRPGIGHYAAKRGTSSGGVRSRLRKTLHVG